MFVPIRVGGGPDEPNKAYAVLRSAEGIGGSAADDSGIDGLWRRSLALGVATASSSLRRSINNAYPHLAQDTLRYYERVLGLVPEVESSEAQRCENVVALWTAKASASVPDMNSNLKRIDERLSVVMPDEGTTTTSLDGRWFGSDREVPVWEGSSPLAGPTTRYNLVVPLDVENEEVTETRDVRAMSLATKLIRTALPSWFDFEIATALEFTLDVSPLDLTVLDDDG